MTDPLQIPLRDIHFPGHLSWWPPAPGWWILLGTVLITGGILWWWRRRKHKLMASALRLARLEFDGLRARYAADHDAGRLVKDLSILLRRLCVSIFPRTASASLTGERWLEFLDRPLPASRFTAGPGRILLDAPYRPRVELGEIEPLLALCDDWLNSLGDYRAGRPS